VKKVPYEKTKTGFLMRSYANMKARVTGVQKNRAHIYLGLSILPKEQFYAWAKSDAQFNKLFNAWERAGYDRTLSPSVDRIDNQRGYEPDNIRWVTQSRNSKFAAQARSAA
jgi:hypothetical protein